MKATVAAITYCDLRCAREVIAIYDLNARWEKFLHDVSLKKVISRDSSSLAVRNLHKSNAHCGPYFTDLKPGSHYRSFRPIYARFTPPENLRKNLVEDLDRFRCWAQIIW